MTREWLSRFKRPLAAALALALAGAGGFYAYKRHQKGQGDPEGPALVRPERGYLELHFTDSGELAPKLSVDVASKVSGRVIELFADEGRRVKTGEKLAVIQPGRTEAERYVPFTVTSPIGGVVMRYQQQGSYQQDSRIAKLGDYVTGLMDSNTPTYLMTVADLSLLVVKMKISEMDVLKLREGMDVTVTVDALPGEAIGAKVTLVSPQAEKDSNNLKYFRVEVTLAKADPRLKPGMTARVDGLLESKKGVLKIPLSAVFEEAGQEVAYLQTGDGGSQRVPLKLGLRNETEAEVQDGVREGDPLLTEKPAEQPGGWFGAGKGKGKRMAGGAGKRG